MRHARGFLNTKFWMHKEMGLEVFENALQARFPGSHVHVRKLHVVPSGDEGFPPLPDKRKHPDNLVLELLTPRHHTPNAVYNFLKRFTVERGYEFTQRPRDLR